MTYNEKLMANLAIIMADACEVTVEEDELTLAVLFIRNHLTTVIHRLEQPSQD